MVSCLFFFNDTATTEIYTLSLHDALPIYTLARWVSRIRRNHKGRAEPPELPNRSEEHTSELQSRSDLVCRLLLEKKKRTPTTLTACGQIMWAAPMRSSTPARSLADRTTST